MTAPGVFQAGEVVDLHLTGAVVIDVGDGYLTVQTAHDEVTVAIPQPDLRITRVAPAGGAPRPGEVWADAFGQIYFARGDDKKVEFHGADARTQHPGRISTHWLDVHREAGPITRIWAPPATPALGEGAGS